MSPPSWFFKGLNPGDTITLDNPVPSTWKILDRLNEIEHQREEHLVKTGTPPSYAALKLRCESLNEPKHEALIRVYMQIPWTNTEIYDPSIRANQATTFVPAELTALETLTRTHSPFTPRLLGSSENRQDQSGLVPGGFVITVAWEVVKGDCLGDETGATKYWSLSPEERKEVREVFQRLVEHMARVGIVPGDSGSKNLVWNSQSKSLFIVGFRDWDQLKPVTPWDDKWFARWLLGFELVKKPRSSRPDEFDWDGNTAEWEY
ncbi:hypothetical protein PITC_000940 [Penicillium italicum]|uniref:Aminoglycoside phosphotransferase n=1 Tax=Penicillium italicum TaxID=40296 RepID=A0A0A2KLI3_PENIT|nr:hypothetical protein PITC_000940 [Penicillium italicum]